MGIGEFFSLASAVAWAFAVILFTRIGDKMPAFELNLAKNLIGLVLVTLTALVIEGLSFPPISMVDLAILTGSGVVGIGLADTLYMRALNSIGAGSTGIVGALYSPFVVLISMIYLGEALSFFQFMGLLLVLSSVVLISLDAPHKPISLKMKWSGIAFGVSSVFLTALCVVVVKPILEHQPFFWTTGFRLFVGVAGMLVYLLLTNKVKSSIAEFKKPHHWGAIVLSAILGAYLAMTLWLAGYKYTKASIAAILNETTAIFIVLLAWIILKERLTPKKILGVLLALTGVLCVIS